MDSVRLGKVEVSRFLVGSNPFSGFSHLGIETDQAMRRWFSVGRIKEVLRQAESLGITGILGRVDLHMIRMILEYRTEGGTLQWLAQTCPGVGPQVECIHAARDSGAVACHLHGGHMDWLFAQGRAEEAFPLIELIHESGMAAGMAAHRPEVHRWAEASGLPVDYYMCSYYNPIPRENTPEHRAGLQEVYAEPDRLAMMELIAELTKPAIHYKVMAAGRNDPAEAFGRVADNLRAGDLCCVGIYHEHKPDMLAEDVRLFTEALDARGK